ncbi:MAG TPA: histidine kinase, partial [Thiolapillus brandeum]|nr:histidine kinase [Thiolapillus brandeum]
MSEHKMIKVRDVMKLEFDMVQGLATVAEALQQMAHVETKCLVVEKRHENDEYGLVMLSDISKNVLARDRAPERVNIYEIMAKPVITV